MEYKKITEVELIEEPSENATVLAEDNGALKRVPYKNVGGGGGIPTAIIKSSDYDNAIAGVQTMAAIAPAVTYECINMTFDEAYAIMASGQPLWVVSMVVSNSYPSVLNTESVSIITTNAGLPCIGIFGVNVLFWTADGLSTDEPSVDE